MQVRQYRGKWVADYSDQFGKRHRPSFDTKREANEHLIEAKSSIMGGTFRSEASKTTVAQVANNFIDDCRQRVAIGELGASTSHNYIGHTERYILGTSDLASPTRTHLKGQFFPLPPPPWDAASRQTKAPDRCGRAGACRSGGVLLTILRARP
ncbi:MAG: hypothetical protein V4701_01310 [Pseudomonadota bacterium]